MCPCPLHLSPTWCRRQLVSSSGTGLSVRATHIGRRPLCRKAVPRCVAPPGASWPLPMASHQHLVERAEKSPSFPVQRYQREQVQHMDVFTFRVSERSPGRWMGWVGETGSRDAELQCVSHVFTMGFLFTALQ